MTIPKVNLGLVFFLFVLFAGMTFAWLPISECGVLDNPGVLEENRVYYLTQDIVAGSGGTHELLVGEPLSYCFMINASYITLDCQGHTISTDVDMGIFVNSYDEAFPSESDLFIEVKNCTIENTKLGGIYTYDTRFLWVFNSTFRNNGADELRSDLLACTGAINILCGERDANFENFIAYNTFENNSMGICTSGRRASIPGGTIIRNNTISNSRFAGITFIENSWGNSIFNNTIYNNTYGVFLTDSKFNVFEDLNISNNKYADIMGDPVFEEEGFCTNSFRNVIVTGGQELIVVDTPNIVIDPNYLFTEYGIDDATIPSTQMIVCRDNVTIKDVYMHGDPDYRNNGLFIMGEGRAYNITINNLTATNLMAGVYAQLARNITIQNSTFENNQYGIIFNSVKGGDFSYNTFNENTAAGIFGTTSPAYYFYLSFVVPGDPLYNYFYQVSNLTISNNEFTNTGYGPSMSDAYPPMLDLPGGFITHFVDMGTGSAIELILTKNVTVSDNVIYNASTYGIYSFYGSSILLIDNEIDLIDNVTEFDPDTLDFGEVPPEDVPMVDALKYMLSIMPGTSIFVDGADVLSANNLLSNNIYGYVSSPVSYSIDQMIKGFGGTGFLPDSRNYFINNDVSGEQRAVMLAGPFGDVVYHNKFDIYITGVEVYGQGNIIVDNIFNTTNYHGHIEGTYENTFNVSDVIPPEYRIVFTENILGGSNFGGNYWGLTNGEGYSDTCDDINPVDGFCDDKFILNGTNNTDFRPLSILAGSECFDDFECWISIDFGDGFFCNIETECEECVPECDEDEYCVYDPVLGEGVCKSLDAECIDLDLVRISPDGNITNEYGDVKFHNNIFYINDDTTLCPKTYTTNTNGVFIQMNGSHSLNCSQGIETIETYHMYSTTGNAIGILNHYDDVTIRNCNFRNFAEGVVSTPDPFVSNLQFAPAISLFDVFVSTPYEPEPSVPLTPEQERELAFQNYYIRLGLFDYNTDGYLRVGGYIFSRYYNTLRIFDSDYEMLFNEEITGGRMRNRILKLENECGVVWYNRSIISKYDCDGSELWNSNLSVNKYTTISEDWSQIELYDYSPTVLGFSEGVLYHSNISGGTPELYKSIDNGTTWELIGTTSDFSGVWGQMFTVIRASEDNSKIIMVHTPSLLPYESKVYYTLDSGTTWDSVQPAGNVTYVSADVSDDGGLMAVALGNATLYTCDQNNFDCSYSGNWTKNVLPGTGVDEYLYSMVMSGNGRYIFAAGTSMESPYVLYIFDSVLGSVSGVNLPDAGNYLFYDSVNNEGMAVSEDGSKLVVGLKNVTTNEYHLFMYYKDGVGWVDTGLSSSKRWASVYISADGNVILAGLSDGRLYLTTNGGESLSDWEEIQPAGDSNFDWIFSGISSNGESKFVYANNNGFGGYIYNETTIEVSDVESVYPYIIQSPVNDNIYAYLINGERTEDIAELKAFDITDGSVLWEVTIPFVPDMNVGQMAFDNENNLLIVFKNSTDTYLYKLNSSNGDILFGTPYPGTYYKEMIFPFMFVEDEWIYDVSIFSLPGDYTNQSTIRLQRYNLDGELFAEEYIVPFFHSSGITKIANLLFDGEYIYYTVRDTKTGSCRLYYKVFDLTFNLIAEGEFKPNSEEVFFNSYLNEDGNVEFIGIFYGNNSNTPINFMAYLNKSNDFEFVMVHPYDYVINENEYIKSTPDLNFVEYDFSGNIFVVGEDKYPYVSRIKLLKYDNLGNVLLNRNYTFNEESDMIVSDFIIDSDDDLVIVGYYLDELLLQNYFIMKIDGESGDVLLNNTLSSGYTNYYNNKDFFRMDFKIIDAENNYSALLYDGSRKSLSFSKEDLSYVELYSDSSSISFDMVANEDYACILSYGYVENNWVYTLLMINTTSLMPLPDWKEIRVQGGDYRGLSITPENQCVYYYGHQWGANSTIIMYASSGDSILEEVIFDTRIRAIKTNSSGSLFILNATVSGDASDKMNLIEYSTLGLGMDEIMNFTYINRNRLIPSNIALRENNYVIIGESEKRFHIKDYFVMNFVGDELEWYDDYLGLGIEDDSVPDELGEFTESNFFLESVKVNNLRSIGVQFNLLQNETTSEIIDSSFSFYNIFSNGAYSKLFDYDGEFGFPSKVIYNNNRLYVLFGISNASDFNPEEFNSGRYKVYSFDMAGDIKWELETDMYSLGNMMSYSGAMGYDPSGYLLVSGSDMGEELPNGIPIMNSYNLTKINANTGIVVWNKELPSFGYVVNWIKEIHVLSDGYLIVGGGAVSMVDGPGGPSIDGDARATFLIKTDKDGEVVNVNVLGADSQTVCSGGWEYVSGFENASLTSLTISKDGSVMVAGNETEEDMKKVYDFIKSYDNGSTWESFGPDVAFDKEIISISLSEDGTSALVSMYNFTDSKGAVSYTDNFADETPTWVTHKENHLFKVTAISADGQDMFAGRWTNGTLYNCDKSTQDCADWNNWNEIFDSSSVTEVYSLAVSGDGSTIVYVVFNASINSEEMYISTKGGDTFSLISDAPRTDFINDKAIAISNDGSKILFGADDGIYLSSDGGEFENVINVSEGFVSPHVSMSSDGNDMMASIRSRLHYSTNGGSTWAEVRPTGLDENKDWFGLGIDNNEFRVAYFRDRDDDNGLYIFTDSSAEVCESELLIGENVVQFMPLNSFKIDNVPGNILFIPVSDLNFEGAPDMTTLMVDGDTGIVIQELDVPFMRGYSEGSYLHLLSYDLGGSMMYANLDIDKAFSVGIESGLKDIGMVVTPSRTIFDFHSTSYGFLAVGGIYSIEHGQTISALMAYTTKKTFDTSLNNVLLNEIGIFNVKDNLLIDLSSGDADVESLAIGCEDLSCMILFYNVDDADGYLHNKKNVYLDSYFISFEPKDANAQAFNGSARIRLSVPQGVSNIHVIVADGFYTNRQDILANGRVLDIPLTCSGGMCVFTVDGFSSYTLGYSDDPSPDDDMGVTFPVPICVGQEYELKPYDVKTSSYLNFFDYRVNQPYFGGWLLLTQGSNKDVITFTPKVVGTHELRVERGGYNTLITNFLAIDCSIPDECSLTDPLGRENYILVVDNFPDCQYACEFTADACEYGETFVDDSLGCRCVILTCPAPEENYKFVINDWPTCTYECAIDQDYCETEFGVDYVFDSEECACTFDEDGDSEMDFEIYQDIDLPDIELGINEVCVGLPFIVDVVSLDRDCLVDTQLDIPAAGIYGKTTLDNVVISELGTYEATLMKSGCRTTRGFIKVIDCGEMEYEDPFDVPVETAFFEDIINIFRNSIKGGCEGFYFEGIPTILCDLVWVIVIIGSLGAAYLEPLKNRKVISLVTPSVVAIVLIPLAGAIAAAGFVYLAYNSKKHVESKLEYEREQMEEEINKE